MTNQQNTTPPKAEELSNAEFDRQYIEEFGLAPKEQVGETIEQREFSEIELLKYENESLYRRIAELEKYQQPPILSGVEKMAERWFKAQMETVGPYEGFIAGYTAKPSIPTEDFDTEVSENPVWGKAFDYATNHKLSNPFLYADAAVYGSKVSIEIPTEGLREEFEKLLDNCFPVGFPGIGWHQLGDETQQEFIDAMQAAYNLSHTSQESKAVEVIKAVKNSPDRFKRKAGYNQAIEDLLKKIENIQI